MDTREIMIKAVHALLSTITYDEMTEEQEKLVTEYETEKWKPKIDELKAFAWAGYYTNYSDIFINGKEYHVVHVTDSAIEFPDGTLLPVGCYAIFKCDDETRFCNDYELRNIRNNSPLSNHFYCLTDEEFMKIA